MSLGKVVGRWSAFMPKDIGRPHSSLQAGRYPALAPIFPGFFLRFVAATAIRGA